MLKIFSLNSAEFVTLNRIFSTFIGFLGALTVYGPSTDGTAFVPSETNSSYAPADHASWWKILVPVCLDDA